MKSGISNLVIELDSVEKIVTTNKWGVDSSLYAHYSLTNKSDDTIVFVTNSCPSLNKYSLEINDSSYVFNSKVNCSFNAFTFDTLTPGETIQISDLLLTNTVIPFDNTQTLIFSIPIVKWKNGEYQVNGSIKEAQQITFVGTTKFTIKNIDTKKKKS